MKKFGWTDQGMHALWLLLISVVVVFLPVFFIVWKVLGYTNGVFMYPFDDTFIHLKIADNVLKGNWGINENSFASASSSILYTLVLAAVRLISGSVLVPFIVNCFAGLAIVLALHYWLKKQQMGLVAQALVLLLVAFFTPLALVIVSGMEHTLQCLFSFLFIFYFADWLEQGAVLRGKMALKIFLFAVLVSTIRYEGVFLIAIACLLLIINKKFASGLWLAVVALLPLILFGIISVKNGNYFFPNSVLIKSESFSYSSPVQQLYQIVFEKLVYARNGMAALATQRLTVIIPLLYFLFRRFLKPSQAYVLMIVWGATILQLAFAATGYLYRYEAYLFFSFIVITAVLFHQHGRSVLASLSGLVPRFIALALVFFLIFPVVLRSLTALDKTGQASINIYDQQYQMASFTRQFYNQSPVALNDIGAVSYFTNAHIVDLWGLASPEVAKSKKDHYWTAAFLDSFSRQNKVEFAILYDVWFPGSLGAGWHKVASWDIQNNVICGDSMVSFYSPDATSKTVLQKKLMLFEPRLPGSVEVRYY